MQIKILDVLALMSFVSGVVVAVITKQPLAIPFGLYCIVLYAMIRFK